MLDEATVAKLDRKYARKLKPLINKHDIETAHSEGDALLLELLTELGIESAIRQWKEIPKWYA